MRDGVVEEWEISIIWYSINLKDGNRSEKAL